MNNSGKLDLIIFINFPFSEVAILINFFESVIPLRNSYSLKFHVNKISFLEASDNWSISIFDKSKFVLKWCRYSLLTSLSLSLFRPNPIIDFLPFISFGKGTSLLLWNPIWSSGLSIEGCINWGFSFPISSWWVLALTVSFSSGK